MMSREGIGFERSRSIQSLERIFLCWIASLVNTETPEAKKDRAKMTTGTLRSFSHGCLLRATARRDYEELRMYVESSFKRIITGGWPSRHGVVAGKQLPTVLIGIEHSERERMQRERDLLRLARSQLYALPR